MGGATLDSVFRNQMLALGIFSLLAFLLQWVLSRLAAVRAYLFVSEWRSILQSQTFQLAGALFCLLNFGVAVFRYHYGSPPANAGGMAIKMLFNAGVMGTLAIAGYWASRRIGSRWRQTAHALLAWAGQSAALVFFDLICSLIWFWHFTQGV